MASRMPIHRVIRATACHAPSAPSSLLVRMNARSGLSSRIASSARGFRSSAKMMETPAVAIPVKKPVGAFRGGLLGFLLGSTLAGAGVYYYVLEEYRVSNELLTEDIYSLQAAVQRIHTFVSGMEERLDTLEKKKGGSNK